MKGNFEDSVKIQDKSDQSYCKAVGLSVFFLKYSLKLKPVAGFLIYHLQTACQSCTELYIVPNHTKYTREWRFQSLHLPTFPSLWSVLGSAIMA